ncbi:MAG TPA: hypothetical protein VJN18_20450 [Polyangiaceae bacterium]|nr:hypothetical protein [Polyangiaceae bacterium]
MSSTTRAEPQLPPAVVRAFRDDQPLASELDRAYVKFLRRRRGRVGSSPLVVARWLIAGMALGIGVVYAATDGPWRALGRRSSAPTPPAAQSTARRVSSPASSSPRSVASIFPIAPSRAGSTGAASVASAPGSAAPAKTRAQWQRAARGLREQDFESADAALDELEAQGDAAEREAARLVRAQLLLSQGRRGEALPLLRALQATAESGSVRSKASELLAASKEGSSSQRSFALPEDTK